MAQFNPLNPMFYPQGHYPFFYAQQQQQQQQFPFVHPISRVQQQAQKKTTPKELQLGDKARKEISQIANEGSEYLEIARNCDLLLERHPDNLGLLDIDIPKMLEFTYFPEPHRHLMVMMIGCLALRARLTFLVTYLRPVLDVLEKHPKFMAEGDFVGAIRLISQLKAKR